MVIVDNAGLYNMIIELEACSSLSQTLEILIKYQDNSNGEIGDKARNKINSLVRYLSNSNLIKEVKNEIIADNIEALKSLWNRTETYRTLLYEKEGVVYHAKIFE